MSASEPDPRRRIPSVDALLTSPAFERVLAGRSRALVVAALRRTLGRLREQVAAGKLGDVPDDQEIAARTENELSSLERPTLRPVINATGIPLHTNLGRAPLPDEAIAAVTELAGGYSNLEYKLDEGARGSRHEHCAGMLRELTGAEAALIVNNNAAALVLVLNELADGRDVVISRGELVEIGGSFRVPEIIQKSGAQLAEVGSTNRTHARDYSRAIGPETGALLKVHRSNFSVSGFVSDVSLAELVPIAREAGLPLVHDIGSGLVRPTDGIEAVAREPAAADSLAAGADVVTFSGDKLLGGPQAGIILGRAELIDRLRLNPLLRALRVGKLTLAALAATLRLWLNERAADSIPALVMLAASPEELRAQAESIAAQLSARAPDAGITVERVTAEAGAGSSPGVELEGWAVRIEAHGLSESRLEAALRCGSPPVITVVRDGAVWLDPRTVLPDEHEDLIRVAGEALAAGPHAQ